MYVISCDYQHNSFQLFIGQVVARPAGGDGGTNRSGLNLSTFYHRASNKVQDLNIELYRIMNWHICISIAAVLLQNKVDDTILVQLLYKLILAKSSSILQPNKWKK